MVLFEKRFHEADGLLLVSHLFRGIDYPNGGKHQYNEYGKHYFSFHS
jgi:hypothetical protein